MSCLTLSPGKGRVFHQSTRGIDVGGAIDDQDGLTMLKKAHRPT